MFFAGLQRRIANRSGNSHFGTSVVCLSGSVFTIGLNCAVRSGILQEWTAIRHKR